jgi:RNA polymerase sigma factor (sigma-70 family)
VQDNSQIYRLIDHLFRHESGKLISVLTRIFGNRHLEIAEDVVQESFLEAINVWTYKGIPQNPGAWLYTVAKNKALNAIDHENYKHKYVSDVLHLLKSEWTAQSALDHLFSEQEIIDDQLRMMFTCCHPALSPDSQIALMLKTLCGFSIQEIARAFLATEDTVNKRLVRARRKIREADIPFAIPQGNELAEKLDTVLEAIYLLFNEGYSASVGEDLIRYELCEEAIRLSELIADHDIVNKHSNVYALLSLMYLNASRFRSRQDEEGNIVPLSEQDRTRWNRSMMSRGFSYLEKITTGGNLSKYHILAAISAHHCSAVQYDATDWNSILTLYDNLVHLDNSPLVLLNRAVALSKIKGLDAAISELEKIKNEPALNAYPLLYSTLAELYMEGKSFTEAAGYLIKAIKLSPVRAEKELLKKRLEMCRNLTG